MAPRMLAIYGKGGMGKSFFTSNLTSRLTMDGQRVLQLGCDPKHDSCNTIFGGHSLPTLGDVWRSFKEANREDELAVGDVIFRNKLTSGHTIYGCELGGPEVGRGCGGQGISFGFKLLENLGMPRWGIDYVVMDFLGDVVCGGFATPLSRSLAEEVIIVVGHDRQSLYAANNIASAAKYFRSMGGRTKVLGLIVNRDDGSRTADDYAEAVGLPILTRIPLSRTVRELADACKLALEDAQFNAIFADLADRVHNRRIPPCEDYQPLAYHEFLRVFGAEEPPGRPDSATADELFAGKKVAAAIPMFSLNAMPTHPPKDALETRVVSLMAAIDMTPTEIQREKDGMTVTVGAIEVALGEADELEGKLAFLAALRKSGQHFSYVDLRYADAPMYR